MKYLLRAAGLLIAISATVSAVEAQLFAYLASAMRNATGVGSSVALTSPAEVIDSSAERITLLAAGDIADCPERPGFPHKLPTLARALGLPSAFDLSDVAASDTAKMAASWPDAPILALGDLVYRSGTPAEFEECFDPVWGGLKERILPAPGNHEYKSPFAFGYFDYWGDRAGPDRRGYYAIKTANWLILSLNSEIDGGPDSDQGLWLQDQLDTVPEACVLAFFHKPSYSLLKRNRSENAVALFQQLQRNGATVVLNGHNHFYERTRPLDVNGEIEADTGTTSFVVGTGGNVSDDLPSIASTDKAIFEKTGLLRLELDPTAYRWWYHATPDGAVLDSGGAPCNPTRRGSSSS